MIKNYRKFTSLRTKLSLLIGLITFLVSAILIFYTTQSAREQAVAAAHESAMEHARDYAAQVEAEIEKALSTARTLAQTFSGIKADENPLSISRAGANAMLKEVVEQNPSFFGVYTSWEPNAFDGMDTAFVNADVAHDTSGRFIPYWFKGDGGKVMVETVLGYDTDTYYTIPETTKKEVIIDPVTYTVDGGRVSLTSIIAPVVKNNRFYGLTGVDIATDWMQEMIKNANLYDGKAEVNVVSHNGTITATTLTDTLLGYKLLEAFPEYNEQEVALKQGTEGFVFSDDYLKAYAPIHIGESSTPWQVSVKIPSALILAEANAQLWQMIFISSALLILSLVLIYVVVQRLVKPLDTMVAVTTRMAEGDLSQQQIKTGNDEIGLMGNAFTTLMNGLRKTTEFANEIGKGNLDAEFTALSEKDILGNALIAMRNSLQSVAEEDRKRNWVTEGTAIFGDILRKNNDDIHVLADNIVSRLVKYLEANQGGMFILTGEEGEQQLELIATYAWERRRIRNKIIGIEEGLAGQVVLEKDYIYLTDVPSDYVNIKSGLGGANPTAILIVPLKINEKVMGVLELASFKKFEQYQIEFIEKIGETIASTLSSVQINQTTRQLLEESRLSAEEKRAAEEELLQNQEELQATQEELQRTINELKAENQRLQNAQSDDAIPAPQKF
ncbi:GAF domain-containing protein [Nafulsella turpanensis]|uniref:GAF domain-containing protein n=1 Tax=Nafulsella turpanensis TaxID=1265690 RepID=UPI000344E60B|nr:GAF domain-containing protein [Nafulsella turpanensis]